MISTKLAVILVLSTDAVATIARQFTGLLVSKPTPIFTPAIIDLQRNARPLSAPIVADLNASRKKLRVATETGAQGYYLTQCCRNVCQQCPRHVEVRMHLAWGSTSRP